MRYEFWQSRALAATLFRSPGSRSQSGREFRLYDIRGRMETGPASAPNHKMQADSNMSEDLERKSASQKPTNWTLVAEPGVFSVRGTSAVLGVGPRTRITLDLSPEAAKALDDLIGRTGDTPSDLFRKALGLYALAEEAKRKGKPSGSRQRRTPWRPNSSDSRSLPYRCCQ